MNIFLGAICLRKKKQNFLSQTHLKLRNMSRAEKFICEHTRNCSNEFEPQKAPPSVYNPWLTPDQARRAVEIAREEMMEKVCDYIKNNLYKHLYVYDGHAGFPTHQFINDLKQAMRDE